MSAAREWRDRLRVVQRRDISHHRGAFRQTGVQGAHTKINAGIQMPAFCFYDDARRFRRRWAGKW